MPIYLVDCIGSPLDSATIDALASAGLEAVSFEVSAAGGEEPEERFTVQLAADSPEAAEERVRTAMIGLPPVAYRVRAESEASD